MSIAPPPPTPASRTTTATRLNLQHVVAIDVSAKTDVQAAVRQAAEALFRKQRDVHWSKPSGGPQGRHWCAELEGDSILSSEYILMKFILGQERDPRESGRLLRINNQLRLSQRPDGSWGQYPASPPDISACVKAYLALKLMGEDITAPHMVRAKTIIRALGGAEACNTFSTFYLACLGIVSWNACPAIPPQIVLLPRWFPFHMSKVAAWTRTMILPLALCSALQPTRHLDANIDELFLDVTKKTRLNKPFDTESTVCWRNFFLLVDRFLKGCRAIGFTPFRTRAIKLAEKWIASRMTPQTTEGLGAIFPPMVYVQIAFQKLGYTRDHPLIAQAERDLDAFLIDEPNTNAALDHIRLQPCFSPVWDTAIALDALAEAGFTAAEDDRIAQTCDWLRDREVKMIGDWYDNLRPQHRHLRPGINMACWAFEYKNDWYPDVDDTCMVAKALYRVGDRPGESSNRDAAQRAIAWILAMQNDDHGWAAFDRTKDRPWMEAIPFADHNAMQDPSCSDITGRVTEALVTCGVDPNLPELQHAMDYLLRTQQPEGCWWGRWGCNYIYGTWQAVNGLIAAACESGGTGVPPVAKREDVRIALTKVRNWLLACQNADGGFGESANSYLDRTLMGKGPSTASQTAWALMTLMHVLPIDHPAITRAAHYLCGTQLIEDKKAFMAAKTVAHMVSIPSQRGGGEGQGVGSSPASSSSPHDTTDAHLTPLDPVTDLAGSWSEHWFTGTGFPKVFYLRYHYYRHSFPLKALARYSRLKTRLDTPQA